MNILQTIRIIFDNKKLIYIQRYLTVDNRLNNYTKKIIEIKRQKAWNIVGISSHMFLDHSTKPKISHFKYTQRKTRKIRNSHTLTIYQNLSMTNKLTSSRNC